MPSGRARLIPAVRHIFGKLELPQTTGYSRRILAVLTFLKS
ncbi:hypothetical protein [Streptomyces sp. NRRL S-1448]|nr:hypothetical protein [Streptomyces sp. NRRL S-1448]